MMKEVPPFNLGRAVVNNGAIFLLFLIGKVQNYIYNYDLPNYVTNKI